ncbi:MAG: tetratricopeptide repeat protein [Acidobacteria bacterium]|nr:tetratricopeptide repeat protein [Acidobacteriota bacterium]
MKKYVILSLFFLLFATAVQALMPAGLVIFQVRDENGTPIKGVHIVVHNKKDVKFEAKLVTDEKGKAKVLLKLGHFDAKFTKDGFAPFEKTVKPLLGDRKTIQIKMESVKEAVKKLQESEKLTPEQKAIMEYNNLVPLLKKGDDAAALPKLQEIMKLDPNLAPVLFQLGRIELKNNQLDDAEKMLLKAISLKPDLNPVYGMLAEVYKRKGDKENYEKYLKEAELRGAVSAGVYYNQAVEAINNGKDDTAIPLLEKAIKVNPEFVDSYYQLGMCFMRSGAYAKSIENLQKYLSIKPDGKHAAEAKQFITALKSMQ